MIVVHYSDLCRCDVCGETVTKAAIGATREGDDGPEHCCLDCLQRFHDEMHPGIEDCAERVSAA